ANRAAFLHVRKVAGMLARLYSRRRPCRAFAERDSAAPLRTAPVRGMISIQSIRQVAMSDSRNEPDDQIEQHEQWDANDPRRQKDCFAPPAEPCECYCLHCNRVFISDQIWF